MSEPASVAPVSVTIFGIPNCDTVKKARAWLTVHAVDHAFHDFKKAGLSRALVDEWVNAVGWEQLINRKGMTWRNLGADRQAMIAGEAPAVALMLEFPSIIRRPILRTGSRTLVGFDILLYSTLLKAQTPVCDHR